MKDIFNKQHDLIRELYEKVIIKKEELITERLKELKIDIDFEKEKRNKFKSLLFEKKEDEEIVYYNDGSKNGIRVITFINTRHNLNLNNDIRLFKITYNISYY